MSEENENLPAQDEQSSAPPPPANGAGRGGFITRRRLTYGAGAFAVGVALFALLAVVLFRIGFFDNYIKAQFVAKMQRIGIEFTADTFKVGLAPLRLDLRNATFNDRTTGAKLFFIKDAKIGLTVTDLYKWQLSREIRVDSTEVDGAEAWVTFDENGKSNFSNLQFVEEESRVSFNYTSVRFGLKNAVVHYGDTTRRLGADANNVVLNIGPLDATVPDDQKRYQFELGSTGSNFTYEDRKLEEIDLRVEGVTDARGADISGLRLKTPIGESNLKGRVEGWESPKYNFEIESTVDLTRTSQTFPLGAPLTGIGNFVGTVSGEGEKYQVKGEITSESLAASNVYLKGLNINAAVDGNGPMYEANGKAIAQMLTFEDFKIDYPQLIGLVRGNGADFKWVGELQAAAAKTPFGTIGRLFLTDAVAELKDGKFGAGFGSGRTTALTSKGFAIENLQASNGRIGVGDNKTTTFTAGGARAGKFKTKAFELDGVEAKGFKLRDVPKRTDIEIDSARADRAAVDKLKFRGVTANGARVGYENGNTTFTSDKLRADGADIEGARIGGLEATNFDVRDVPAETIVTSDGLRVAKIETNAAVLGSLNIAGVRLTVRQGRVEGTSKDIDAGRVLLAKNSSLPQGGALEDVKIAKPVFVLEPSGAYRASADMSLGGGAVGTVSLGAARASVTIDNDRVVLEKLDADVMNGKLAGRAEIAFNERNRSVVAADFSGLDLAKLLALQGGRVVPLEGEATGRVDFEFAGTNFRTATGKIAADIAASAGTADRGLIPVAGRVEATATNGLFNLDVARLTTAASRVDATGRFDLNGYQSNLDVALESSDASEIDRIVKVLNLSPDFNQVTDEYRAEFAGALTFKGKVTGQIDDPEIEGAAQLESLRLRGRNLGAVKTDISVGAAGTNLRNGLLTEPDGGELAFDVDVPSAGANNIAVRAKLTNINTGNILAALPVELPETLRGLDADTSGTVELSGLPNAMQGEARLTAKNGALRGQTFDNLETHVLFAGSLVTLDDFRATFGDGKLGAKGTYRTDTTEFDVDVTAENVPIARIEPFVSTAAKMPDIGGAVGLTAKLTGKTNDPQSLVVNFGGQADGVTLNGNAVGDVTFSGKTENRRLGASVIAKLEGQEQRLDATVDFSDPDLPFRAETNFNNTELAPFIALVREPGSGVAISGQTTGNVFIEGNLSTINAKGEREFSANAISGAAELTQLALQIGDTPLAAVEPVSIRFDMYQVVVQNAKFAGGGSNLVATGTLALRDDGVNNFNLDGRINLSILNAVSPNAFFAGLADVNMRLTGPNKTARLNGTAEMQNASASAFIGGERITFDRLKGRAIFTSNQVQIDNLTGLLGGGKFTASGGVSFGENLQLQAFRVVLGGSNVTVPLPKNFLTTGDAEIEINGRRQGAQLATFISGRINAKRSLYSQNIDLADVIGGRREGSISQSGGSGASTFGVVNLDLTVEGRDALVVRNNLADLTASLSLRVTGDFDAPQVEGRITADRGTLFYRNDRYEIQRGELVFPPNSGAIDPSVNLQAESEINGYQIFLNLNGKLTETENLTANVRSNPALPQADVISLITTGSLANTDTGLPTLAQSGINTAAEIITDEIINKPIAKATDKLFGLNKFQLDPIISGQRNPGARLTVGRQINRNLLVTYSTNLSEDQNQIISLEYRVSNRLSFVAQYEQRSLTNVTRNRDNFSVEIRLRKRF